MNVFSNTPNKVFLLALSGAFIGMLIPGMASAAAPVCATYSGGGYCQYDGKVPRAYINAYGQVLLYFDAELNLSAPASVGISGVSERYAAVYPISENPDFAKALYATLLAAQSRGATVQVQMHGSNGGYLKMDRIWILEN